MNNKADIIKKLEAMSVNDNHNFERSVRLVAGAGCQRYIPLITALDIGAKPPSTTALLSAFLDASAALSTGGG